MWSNTQTGPRHLTDHPLRERWTVAVLRLGIMGDHFYSFWVCPALGIEPTTFWSQNTSTQSKNQQVFWVGRLLETPPTRPLQPIRKELLERENKASPLPV